MSDKPKEKTDEIKGGAKDIIQGIVWLMLPLIILYLLYLAIG